MAKPQALLSARFNLDKSWTLDVAKKAGVYETAKKTLGQMKRETIKEEVKKANIRGRGGAGFPAGVKWGFLNPKEDDDVYLVVNGDESEPGTFKDRSIMDLDPHRLIEGCIITCFAIGAHVAYIYVRGELAFSIERLEAAVAEAKVAGILGDRPFGVDHPVEVHIHSGAGAYICGEETALLNSLEGRRGEPRLKPPFPAIKGAFGMPTIVNNIETIAAVPDIIEMGGDAWSALGQSPERRWSQALWHQRPCKQTRSVRSTRRHHDARVDRRLRRRNARRQSAQGGDSGWFIYAGTRSAPLGRRAR